MDAHEHTAIATFSKGVLGAVGSFGGAAVSFAGMVEAWLRVGSLVIGIAVGLVTLRSLLKGSK